MKQEFHNEPRVFTTGAFLQPMKVTEDYKRVEKKMFRKQYYQLTSQHRLSPQCRHVRR